MKGVETLGEVPGEIRVGNGSGAAMVAGANLRRVHEKIVNSEGIANEHQSTKPAGTTEPAGMTKATGTTEPARLRPLLDRPWDR
jgi:hypothetical protein